MAARAIFSMGRLIWKPESFSSPEKFRLATGMLPYPALASALRSRWM